MKSSRVVDLTRRKNERGGVVAYTVLSALFLFLAVGLGVDLSHLYTVKAELQNAADAAALAGCTPLDEPDAAKIEEAVDRAIVVLNQNKYNFNNRQFVEGDNLSVADLSSLRQYVRFAVNLSDFDTGNGLSEAQASANPTNIRFVRVITPDVPISIFFSVPILGALRDMSARAVAGFSVPGNTSFCIIPLTAVSCNPGDANCKLGCDKDADPNCLQDNTQFWGFCPGTDPYALQDVEEGELDPNEDGKCDPKREFCKRCTYTIRAAPSEGPSSGDFSALTCAGRGGCALRMALAAAGNCQCTASPGEELEVDTEPGINAGPVRQGLNVRFDDYTACDPVEDPTCTPGCDTNPTDHPPDTNIHQGSNIAPRGQPIWSGINWTQYSAGSPSLAPSHTGQANRRVLILPITPIGQFGDPKDGRELVKPSGFGGFFLQRAVTKGNDGNIRVEYTGDDIIDVIGFDPNGEDTTNIVTPVLYR
jgi:Flp pilus assembly protein TadG